MTSSQDESPASEAAPVAGLCPFLRSRDGGWASNHASRELRCWAVRPPAQPAIPKQRGLCLLAAHAGCATFVAAMAADAVAPGSSGDGAAAKPLVEEQVICDFRDIIRQAASNSAT